MTRVLGGVGSPSLMTTMCLLIASLIAVQALHGHLERRVEVGHVAGRHAVDGAEHAALPAADRPQGEKPRFLPLPVQEPGVVVAGECLDRRLGDHLLPVVPLGDLAGVHDQGHGADALDLDRLDLHVDRQCLLDRACSSSRRRRSCRCRRA